MLTVRIQEKNHSESIMVLKLKDGRVYKRKIMIHGRLLVMEKLYIHYSIPPG